MLLLLLCFKTNISAWWQHLCGACNVPAAHLCL